MKYNQLTTESFINRAKEIHGNKYDYSNVKYINSSTKVCIICPKHGEFWQRPSVHTKGQGCPICGIEKRTKKITSNKEIFIQKARKIHGNKYDYSKVEYINANTEVCIVCPKHGEFWQTPASHLNGRGCNLCSKPVFNTKSFIEKSQEKHGSKYQYYKSEYINSHAKLIVTCPIHGDFLITPNNHLRGNGCPKCSKEYVDTLQKERAKKASFEFENKARKVHGDKYDYSKVEYTNNHTKVCIICPEHGEFWQTPQHHLRGEGCLKCNESNLEREVRVMLEENGINYIQECDYSTFRWLKRQRLDFYLPEYNIAIECQGEQHYFPVSFGSLSESNTRERFKNILEYDKRKRIGCKENDIKLLYYTKENLKKDNELTNLEELLNEIKNGENRIRHERISRHDF